MSETVLRLSGLEKTYLKGTPGEVAVLRGADLALRAGEAVALVAPSGAGKSTLLHIAGFWTWRMRAGSRSPGRT